MSGALHHIYKFMKRKEKKVHYAVLLFLLACYGVETWWQTLDDNVYCLRCLNAQNFMVLINLIIITSYD